MPSAGSIGMLMCGAAAAYRTGADDQAQRPWQVSASDEAIDRGLEAARLVAPVSVELLQSFGAGCTFAGFMSRCVIGKADAVTVAKHKYFVIFLQEPPSN